MASGCSLCEGLLLLKENNHEIFYEAADILLTFANNVIKYPLESKYRRIRVGNAVVTEKLLPIPGGIECLFEMGFEEDGEYFTMASTNSLSRVTQFRDQLQQLMDSQKPTTTAEAKQTNSGLDSKGEKKQASGLSSSQEVKENKPNSALSPQRRLQTRDGESQFLSKLKSSYMHVLLYEDPRLQLKALQCIPHIELKSSAAKKQEDIQKQGEVVDLQDLILLELMAWFKEKFFSWVDQPKCERCGAKTQNAGMVKPTDAELMWGAGRVENYKCMACQGFTRFPRYNHPGKLLETRRGRCGEWANCFTLCCRAMGFEARYVLDWTDHVWTEVYSEKQKKWLHCDPCENACDKPLIYEVGWKKKLSYILAFSKDDIQDVTWRYSVNPEDILTRRTSIRESILLKTILDLREQRQKSLPEPRKKELCDRLVAELVEFTIVKKAGEGEEEGRQSGSLAWRLARGETSSNAETSKLVIIKPTPEEIKGGAIQVKYCCALNQYIRVFDNNQKIDGWQSLVYKSEKIFRKHEHDWKNVYLARKEGSAEAMISWKFDLQGSECVIERLEVQALTSEFENGHVSWRICDGDHCSILHKGGERTVIADMSGRSGFTLEAHLSGGKGDVAWQHTQLFRQNESETTGFPLDIKINLKKII